MEENNHAIVQTVRWLREAEVSQAQGRTDTAVCGALRVTEQKYYCWWECMAG